MEVVVLVAAVRRAFSNVLGCQTCIEPAVCRRSRASFAADKIIGLGLIRSVLVVSDLLTPEVDSVGRAVYDCPLGVKSYVISGSKGIQINSAAHARSGGKPAAEGVTVANRVIGINAVAAGVHGLAQRLSAGRDDGRPIGRRFCTVGRELTVEVNPYTGYQHRIIAFISGQRDCARADSRIALGRLRPAQEAVIIVFRLKGDLAQVIGGVAAFGFRHLDNAHNMGFILRAMVCLIIIEGQEVAITTQRYNLDDLIAVCIRGRDR